MVERESKIANIIYRMNRDNTIDLLRGIAIIIVYLGHSILYHPIGMEAMYPWCHQLATTIGSFNMPLFFILSGYLFSKSQKGVKEQYEGKVKRLLIPYLFTMTILIGMKLVLPASMSYNQAVGGGYKSLVINALCYGGDRWFVYVMFLIYVILIPFKKLLDKRWIPVVLIIALTGLYFLKVMPEFMKLNDVFYFMVFFLAGYMVKDVWPDTKRFCAKYWYATIPVFLLANLVFVMPLVKIPFVFRFILPFTGFLASQSIAELLARTDAAPRKYIAYCGKYSLQFYLFTFCYPIIRWGIVSVLHITNPVVILLSVFVLQLITITIIVEISRRIRFLKIPCGY